MSKKKKKTVPVKVEVVEKASPPKSGEQFLSFIAKLSPLQFNIMAVVVIIIAGYLSYSNSLNGPHTS